MIFQILLLNLDLQWVVAAVTCYQQCQGYVILNNNMNKVPSL